MSELNEMASKRSETKQDLSLSDLGQVLLAQYGYGPIRFSGTDALFERHLLFDHIVAPSAAGPREQFEAAARSARDVLSQRWVRTEGTYDREDPKRIYYMSMEFLIGRSLTNNITNLLLDPFAKRIAEQQNVDWIGLIEEEPDAGLGNGGLGRLAACFLDSMATMQLPAMGYGLRYEYGIFKQTIQDGWQHEQPDNWLRRQDPWEAPHPNETVEVQLNCSFEMVGGQLRPVPGRPSALIGIPFDRPVIGYGGKTINTLRLWAATAPDYFDFQAFSRGDFVGALAGTLAAESSPADRRALARAFVAKAMLGVPTTNALIERLDVDKSLRRILGWERRAQVPSEATFSRAFAEFAQGDLPDKMHAALIERSLGGRIVGVIARDATEIEARERPAKKETNDKEDDPPPPNGAQPTRKRGRPRKDEQRPKPEPTRLERQTTQNVDQMLADLPTACDVGSKKNSKGYKETWIGYKLHLDVACGQIPVSCVLTSASVHDSQVAIPLMTITGARVSYLYDLMDAAYDAAAIHDHSKALGHAPIIDRNYRAQHEAKAEWAKEVERMKLIHMPDPDDRLFDFRTMAERVNARLKDEFGARVVRVRGAIKVKCHLMFGVVALAVDQILRVTQFRPAPA